MGFPNVDPNAVREQQQLGRMRALKQAKNASAVSVKKTLMIIVPIFIAALILVLFFSGAFDRGYTIRWNDRLYRVSDDLNEDLVYELPDGYTLAGNLSFADNPKKAGENLSSNWTMEAELYVKPDNDRIIYITAYKGYLAAKKNRDLN